MDMEEGSSIKIFNIICMVLFVFVCILTVRWGISLNNSEIIKANCVELYIKYVNGVSEEARFVIKDGSVLEVTGKIFDEEVARRTTKLSSKACKEINELIECIKDEEIYQVTFYEVSGVPELYAYIDGKYYQCYYTASTEKYPEPFYKMNSVHKLAYKLVRESPVKFRALLYFANLHKAK